MKNFKKTILLSLFAISCSAVLLTVSFAYAQVTSPVSPSPVSSNSTNNSAQTIPYHPRDPVAYYAEKKQLDDITRNAVLASAKNAPQHRFVLPSSVSKAPTGIEGLNTYSSTSTPDPADVQVAVGPSNVFEMVNLAGQIRDTSGNFGQNVTLNTFFKLTGATDKLDTPRILYDSQSGRWFATLNDLSNATVSIAVSQSNDPTGSWYVYHDRKFASGECTVQPQIGTSDDKFVVSVNEFASPCPPSASASSDGAEYHVFLKSDLTSGATNPQNQSSGKITSDFATMPVQSQSSVASLYMVTDGGAASTTQIRLYNITGQPPSGVSFTNVHTLTVRTIATAPNAPQPVTTTFLETGDTRVLDAAWLKGKLWLALNNKCTPTGDSTFRSCARMILVSTNTTNGKVLQDFDINSSGTYYYYPALRLDGLGGMGTIFGNSDSSNYPSLFASAQATYDPPKSYASPSSIRSGSQYEENPDIHGNALYGVYFGAALDPSNSSKIWIAGEYNTLPPRHPGSSWSTFISSITFDCGPPSSGDWTISTSCTLGGNATAPANVIVQNNAVLSIPNKQTLNIDFANNHLLVKFGAGVLIQAGGKIS